MNCYACLLIFFFKCLGYASQACFKLVVFLPQPPKKFPSVLSSGSASSPCRRTRWYVARSEVQSTMRSGQHRFHEMSSGVHLPGSELVPALGTVSLSRIWTDFSGSGLVAGFSKLLGSCRQGRSSALQKGIGISLGTSCLRFLLGSTGPGSLKVFTEQITTIRAQM